MTAAAQMALMIDLQAKPGARDALLAVVRNLFDAHAREDAFLFAFIAETEDDPDGIRVLEAWAESRADFERRIETHPAFAEFGPQLAPHLAARTLTFLNPPAWSQGRPPIV